MTREWLLAIDRCLETRKVVCCEECEFYGDADCAMTKTQKEVELILQNQEEQ